MADQTLYQFGDDAFANKFVDASGRVAFTISEVNREPTIVIRVTRESAWANLHPTILGPDNSFFYFGPELSGGYLAYGNNRQSILMQHYRRQKREGSNTLYFISQSGKELKWKIAPRRLECYDGRTLLAFWEISHPSEEYVAFVTIKAHAMSIVTEIMTTLVLHRMAETLGW